MPERLEGIARISSQANRSASGMLSAASYAILRKRSVAYVGN